MTLQFIYGRAGKGKTHFCLEEIKKRSPLATHPLILLVPEQYSFQGEKELIKVLGKGGSLTTQVLSFRRLAYRIFNQAGGIHFPHLQPGGKSMLLYQVLRENSAELQAFTQGANEPGFIEILSNLISEFKRYQIRPDQLKKISEGFPQGHPLGDKLADLHLIYHAFTEIIEDKYQDGDDDLTMATQRLKKTKLYQGAEIWVDGFSGFTPQEYLLLAELLSQASRVHISLCIDNLEIKEINNPGDVFNPPRITYKKLLKMARDLGVSVEEPVNLQKNPRHRFQHSPELIHLEGNLHLHPPGIYKKETKNLSLFTASNMFSEIEETAQDIICHVMDEGLRFRDIAVVVGSLEDYEQLISVVFAEYQIPYFIDQKIDIINHPLIRLVRALFAILIDRWSYEDVFSYLKTGLTNVVEEDIDLLENYVLACGIRGSRWTKDEDWEMQTGFLPAEKLHVTEEEKLKEINRIRWQVVKPLLDFRQKIKGTKSPKEISTGLYEFLLQINIPERLDELVMDFRQKGELSLANEYSQVWNILMEAMHQSVEVLGDKVFNLEDFSQVFNIGLQEYQVGLIPPALDQVLVGSVQRSKSHQVAALYILGANDGVLPTGGIEEGILLDRERITLKEMGLELAADTKTKAFEEQYLLYQVLTISQKYLRLSWPIADQEGRALRPSIIVSRLGRLFPLMHQEDSLGENFGALTDSVDTKLFASKNGVFQQLTMALRKRAEGQIISPIWLQIYRWFCQEKDWQSRCLSLKKGFIYQNLAQPLKEDHSVLLYGDPLYTSVSRLEKYQACPFAFFLEYGLKARERKIYQITPPDVGTFMHRVLELFSRELIRGEYSWRTMEEKWCQKQISRIVDEMLQAMGQAGFAASPRYEVMAERLKRVITRSAWLIGQHIRRSSFDPIGYEVDFSEGGQFPSMVISLDSGIKVKLTGRIDRVDAYQGNQGTYLRIVDYKSGRKNFNLSDLYDGLDLQLITYLDAILNQKAGFLQSNLEGENLPAGMFYFRLDDPLIRHQGVMTPEDLEVAMMKELKMRGLLLADVELVRAMDHFIDGDSLIIPARINKGEVLAKTSAAASTDQFLLLRDHARGILREICKEMLTGNVAIQPYQKKGRSSCEYCPYAPVCQFDKGRKENRFRLLMDKKDAEIWALLKDGEKSD